MAEPIGIIGSGAQADELESYFPNSVECAFRALSPKYFKGAKGTISTDKAEAYLDTPVVVALGAPGARRAMAEEWPGNKFATVVSAAAYVDPSAKIGEGTTIAPLVGITTNVVIGKHSLINLGVTISHDCHIGDFVTISPGAHLAGHVTLGDGVFVGIGATISNDISIAAGCVIGAGAVVIRSIEEENTVVVGNPAHALKQNEDWLREI